jgi:hypothetical protein
VRIFLDANILFSAADSSSATHALFTMARKHAELITSPHAWEEAFRNLSFKRPGLAPHLKNLKPYLVLSIAFAPIETAEIPDHDIPILAGALGSECSHLWTSDKTHFGKWYGRKFHGITVVSSILLAAILKFSG